MKKNNYFYLVNPLNLFCCFNFYIQHVIKNK